MMGLFQSASRAPVTVPTDTIVAGHYFDDNFINRSVLLYITLRFDHILDPQRLRHGLERLMELGDWRKLGARVRMNGNGKLEYHIPAAFNDDRPGFVYTHIKHDTRVCDHPLASRIPRPTDHPSIYNDLETLKDLAHRPGGPKYLEDFLCSDEPQLSLHIVSFTDATLVSVSWLHTFLDALAMSSLLNAWVLVLNGRESEVPPVCNFDTDALASLGIAPTEPFTLAKLQLAGFSMLQFSLRYIFDLVFYRDSQRTLYIPAHHIQALKDAAFAEITTKTINQTQQANITSPFLSEGDILCAFLTHLAVTNELPTSTRQIGIYNAFNLRPALASSLLPPAAGVCLSNAVFTVSAFTTACDILNKPLAYTASLIRSSITEQGTRAQVEALAALTRTAVEKTGRPPVFGDGGMRMVIFSNWTKAGFFELDFGAAVVGEMTGPDGMVRARPSFVNPTGESNGLSPRGSWPIIGRDEGGGYWVQGNLRSDLWEGFEKKLAGMTGSLD